MSAKIKQFVFDGIFTLFALGLLLSVCYFLVPKDRLMDSKDFFLRGFCAFFIITAGFIFLRGIASLLTRKLKPEGDKEIQLKIWWKRLLVVAICEVWGLTTLTLLTWGWNTHLLLDENGYNALGRLCWASYTFKDQMISQVIQLFGILPSKSIISITLAFLIQFVIYLIIGLVISIVLCRKTKPVKHQITPFDSAGN